MDAVTYLKEKARLTNNCGLSCDICKFEHLCGNIQNSDPEKAVKIIEQWGNECPLETYMSKVLSVLPLAKTGILNGNLCVQDMFNIKVDCVNMTECESCWKQPYKE